MTWSWKSFGIQLVSTLIGAFILAYGISRMIDSKRGSDLVDSTLISMALGGFLAPLILNAIAGWKAWLLKSPLIVSFIVAAMYSSKPAVGILSVMASAVLYFVTRKCRLLFAYYAPAKKLGRDSGD